MRFEDRTGMQQLFRDTEAGGGVDAILVYDVSCWGRFQDPDQGADLEYRCRSAGIEVHYCAGSGHL